MAKRGSGGGWLGIAVTIIGGIHLAHEAVDDLVWLRDVCVWCRMHGHETG